MKFRLSLYRSRDVVAKVFPISETWFVFSICSISLFALYCFLSGSYALEGISVGGSISVLVKRGL